MEVTFERSKWALAGSAAIDAAASSGLAAKSSGTGPAATSPSNMWACRYQVFTSTAGRLSLRNVIEKLSINSAKYLTVW